MNENEQLHVSTVIWETEQSDLAVPIYCRLVRKLITGKEQKSRRKRKCPDARSPRKSKLICNSFTNDLDIGLRYDVNRVNVLTAPSSPDIFVIVMREKAMKTEREFDSERWSVLLSKPHDHTIDRSREAI